MDKCPIDIENAHYDELFYYALYGKPGVLKDDDPVLLTFMNQRLPPEKQVPMPEVETDDPVVLDLLGKRKLPEPPVIVEKPPKEMQVDTNDENLPVYRRSYILNFDWNSVKGEHRALDYDKYLQVDKCNPTPRMCRLLTMVIFKLLVLFEQHLLMMLQKCKLESSAVCEEIQEFKRSAKDVPRKLSWLNVYGNPFFKDSHYFSCPANKDFQKKRANNEISLYELYSTAEWSTADCKKIEEAIKNQEIAKRSERVERDMLKLSISIDKASKEDVKTELQQKLSKLPSLDSIRNMSLNELCDNLEWEYDWLGIAAQVFQGYRLPEECRGVWRIYLHPKINKSAWTDEENEALKKLVEEYEFQNWEAIAEQLATNRTPLQVMQHYQRNLNPNLINRSWTEEEDELLIKLVASCRIGSRIAWKKIAQYIEGHTKQQIFKHWTYHLNPALNKTPFSKNEDLLLVAAVRSFGEEYSVLAELFPYRSYDQLRQRYKSLMKQHPNTWNDSENEKLLSLVERFGESSWKEISEYFSGRTWLAVREQYDVLKKRMLQDNSISSPEKKTVCEEHKLWKKVQELYPHLKESDKLHHDTLKELKDLLCNESKAVPKNPRSLSHFDRRCYAHFKCISYSESVYENELYEKKYTFCNSRALRNVLQLLHAKFWVPKDGIMSVNHYLVQNRDKLLLQQLLKESFLFSEVKQEYKHIVIINYSLPPNFTTLKGFYSLMIHRRSLLDSQKYEEREELPIKAKEADYLLEKRFCSLFLWPALASAQPPAIDEIPPIEDSVDHIIPKRQKKSTRAEQLNIFEPKKLSKRSRVKRRKKDICPSSPSLSRSCSVGTFVNCPIIEILDDSNCQVLLTSEKQQPNISLPSTSTSCMSLSGTHMGQQVSTSGLQTLSSTNLECGPAGIYSFNTNNFSRTYSRTKKDKTNAS